MTENIAKHIPFNSVIDSSRPKHRPCIQFILIFIAQKQTCISVIFKCYLSESSTSLCHNHKTYHKETKTHKQSYHRNGTHNVSMTCDILSSQPWPPRLWAYKYMIQQLTAGYPGWQMKEWHCWKRNILQMLAIKYLGVIVFQFLQLNIQGVSARCIPAKSWITLVLEMLDHFWLRFWKWQSMGKLFIYDTWR